MTRTTSRRARHRIAAGLSLLLVASGLQVGISTPALALTPATVRASLGTGGAQLASGVDSFGRISGDGNVAAFVTNDGLVPQDTNGVADVYRRNLNSGAVDLVSVSTDPAATNFGKAVGTVTAGVADVDLNQDGSVVSFESRAPDVVAGDSGTSRDVFVRTFSATPTTVLASRNNNGSLPAGGDRSVLGSLSADGTRIAFDAIASFTTSDAVTAPGVVVRDLTTGQTLRVSSVDAGLGYVAISGDGLSVAYKESVSGSNRLKLWKGGAAVPIDLGSNGTPTAEIGGVDAVSYDGTAVTFLSDQPDLVPGDTNATTDGFLYRALPSPSVQRVTVTAAGGQLAQGGVAKAVSDDGTKVAIQSSSSEITTSGFQVFVRDVSAGTTTIASVDSGGTVPANSGAGNPDLSRDGTIVAFTTAATNLAPADTNGADDIYVHQIAPVTTLTPANLSLTIGGATAATDTPPGASEVPVSSIPASAVPLSSLSDVAGVPLRAIDIASSPLRAIPLRAIPLRAIPLRAIPLRAISLADIPLRAIDLDWTKVLATLNPNPFVGVPLQNVTLDQVLDAFDAQPSATGLDRITLSNVDLAGTPLRAITLASVALGATPLRAIPIADAAGNVPSGDAAVFASWCSTLASLGYSCEGLGLTADSPVLALDLAGVPLRAIPLRAIPLRAITFPPSAPLRAIPLRAINLAAIPLGQLPLSVIDSAKRAAVVDCTKVSCSNGTLADAAAAGALVATATFGQLLDAVPQSALPGSLLDLLAGIINLPDYPWQDLPLDAVGVSDFQANGPTLSYQLAFDVNGSGTGTATAQAVLPAGFRYVQGTGTTGGGTPVTPTRSGTTLTFVVPVTGGASTTVSFSARPGLILGTSTSTASVTIGGSTTSVVQAAPVNVLEANESQSVNTVTPPVTADPNTLYISHVGTPGDTDLYSVAAPPKGTRLQVFLGVPSGADFDVTLASKGSSAAPLRAIPLRAIPLRAIPLADQGLDTSSTLSPETLQDVPTVPGQPTRSVSENRASTGEVINTTIDSDPATSQGYTIQVSGFNGSTSPRPYTLYVKQYAPPTPPSCAARTFASAGQGTATPVPTLLGADRTSLLLVAPKRLGDTYGADQAANVTAALTRLASRTDVKGLVYPVDSRPAVAAAYAAWDAQPCKPELANAVFSAVSSIVDEVRAANPGLKNVVVIGGDDSIPMARVADYTQISNEADDAPSSLRADGTGNPVAASQAGQNVLTDDPLGVSAPIAWLDHQLYVPDIAVGRLVETPAAIVGQIDQFVAAGGVLDPKTALTTGYDFLSDGAQAIDAGLGNRIPAAGRSTLINETWSKADAAAAVFPTAGSPDVVALNGHYDHSRALPALGNSTQDESDLFTVADVKAHPAALARRILFTIGCHAGLNLPDSYFEQGNANAQDWAQTYLDSDQKAAVYFANTGYGYGDTAAVALSEQLMAQFAKRLDGSMTVGQAAAFAKQAYFGQLGAYGPYDEKALQEATFYGLPMYRVGTTATAPPAVTTVTPSAPDATGVSSSRVSLSPTFTAVSSPAGGTYYTVGGEAQVTQYRPIVPRTSVPVTPTTAGLVAHGFLTTALASSDLAVVPAVARPVIDLTANEPAPLGGEVAFPTSFSNLTTFATPSGPEQRLVLLPGQVFRDASWQGSGAVERLFSSIVGDVKYSTSSDYVQPFLTNATATVSGGVLSLSVDATDAGGVTTVLVLVKDETGAWRPVSLTRVGTSSTWTGTLSVTGTQIEYLAQAQDSAGNVGITTNKGRYYGALVPGANGGAPAKPPVVTTDPGHPNGYGQWYRTGVSAIVTGSASSYTVAVDGASPSTYTGPVPVTGDGVHRVAVKGSDGSTALLVVPVDRTKPAPKVNGVTSGGQYTDPRPTCSATDATSGVASCTITITGGDATHTRGTLTATATAYDRAGNVATASVTYNAGFGFGGFQQPINGSGHTVTANTSIFKAGSSVPVKFQALDANGNPVQLATAPAWVVPVRSGSTTASPNEDFLTLPATSGSYFTYDLLSKTYQYNWKTTTAQAGYYYKIGTQYGDGTVYWTYVGLR